jgi:hypothetical protein
MQNLAIVSVEVSKKEHTVFGKVDSTVFTAVHRPKVIQPKMALNGIVDLVRMQVTT